VSSTLSGIVSGIVASIEGSTMRKRDKVRENRLRRMAERQGLALRKSRRRDPRAIDYGEVWLVRHTVYDPATGRAELVASSERSHDAWVGPFRDLDEVEAFLRGELLEDELVERAVRESRGN